uniref:Tetratricopeptide repeat domain 24 n=1 Tax=Astyanax mexicanus TaxID=7994 RepID=A0A3B1IQF6_ASTMX
MASDGSPSRDSKKKKKKSSKKGKSEDAEDAEVRVDIESLTACGHSALQRGDCAEALEYFKKAFKAAAKLKETKVQRACAFNLGAAYVEAGKPQKGLDFLSRAETGERGERVADLQFNLAAAHETLENHSQASRHYLQAAQLYRSQGDGGSEGDTCLRLARCHLRRKEWPEAVNSYLRAAESYKVAGKPASAAVALKDAGNHMVQCDGFSSDDVISVLTECLELSANITEQEALGKLYNAVGLSFSQLNLFPEAAECYGLALPLVQSTPRRRVVVLQNLGAVHNTLAQFQQALKYHREAAALHDDSSGQWQACEGLAGIKMRMNEPEKAIVYYKQALAVLSKCKDVSSSVQESLVNKLSEALQVKLAVQQRVPMQRGPYPRRAVQERMLHRQRVTDTRIVEESLEEQRRREMLNSRRIENNSQEFNKEWRPKETYGPRKPHGDMIMPSRITNTEQPAYVNALPEANRNLNNTYEKPDVQHQNPTPDSHAFSQQEPKGEISRQKPDELRSEPLLEESTEESPVNPEELAGEESTPLHRKIRSRFCTVM